MRRMPERELCVTDQPMTNLRMLLRFGVGFAMIQRTVLRVISI